METFGDARDGWSKIYVLYISQSFQFYFYHEFLIILTFDFLV